jgi:hypothetical protein
MWHPRYLIESTHASIRTWTTLRTLAPALRDMILKWPMYSSRRTSFANPLSLLRAAGADGGGPGHCGPDVAGRVDIELVASYFSQGWRQSC